MKSGPTLAAAGRWPAWRRAAISPVATVVLPTPEWVPADHQPGTESRRWTGADQAARPSRVGRGDVGYRCPAMALDVRHPDPVGGGPWRPASPSRPTEGLLLVAHGSECVRSAEEMRAPGRPGGRAPSPASRSKSGYLEMTEPPAGAQADRLVARGCRRVVVLPLMLLGAGHAKSDVPAVVVEARDRHPQVDVPVRAAARGGPGAGGAARQGGGGRGRGRVSRC